MAQQPSSSGWHYSQSLGQWVWYDAQRNRYILQNGIELPSSTQLQNPGSQVPQYTLASAESSAQGNANSPLGASALVGGLENLTIDQRTTQTTSRVHNGIRWVDARNPDTGVSTRIATDPPNLITEPGLWSSGRGGGVRAHRMLAGNSQQETEALYPSFKLRQKDFFREGRVFLILWTEPAGEPTATTRVTDRQSPEVNDGIIPGLYGQRVFSKVRRFVIIREGDLSCSALPITTLRTYLASGQQPRPAAAASQSVASSSRANQRIVTTRHPDTIPRATLPEQEDDDNDDSEDDGTDDEDENEATESVSATHGLRAS
ncbi:hypothetical protein KC316_g2326 [Hortaea werneckii]|nr:hypothetical protein KC324_g2322 [Hortaea werneckii]KAI7592360.1 hypothetical protein KC316_g2326 [Hortaea werneckii]